MNRSFEWVYLWVYLNGKFARNFVSKEVSKASSDTNFKLLNDGFSFILSFIHRVYIEGIHDSIS